MSAINSLIKTSWQFPAMESKYNQFNFGGPQIPGLYVCNHYSSARCEMTSLYTFIPLLYIAFNRNINWSQHWSDETYNEYVT